MEQENASDVARAIDLYREILTSDPTHAPTLAAQRGETYPRLVELMQRLLA